ncbi:hypothetical protein AC579_3594 [Pseudocercospora musae]|uniref:Uncharacterized protein n=1 Tax=Pseudocercospora musae TaxID=113226 RepID=A0A139GU31_9PEZI|nr:hypothetical protein AC579_3594 [Pseudocercospora musae]KXS93677.1 hypothetical protein AC579_3594 [Pseudocercospora musae]
MLSMDMQVRSRASLLYPRLPTTALVTLFLHSSKNEQWARTRVGRKIIMGAGAFIEPLVVISLLVGGTLVNRETRALNSVRQCGHKRNDNLESGASSPRSKNSQDGLLSPVKLLEQNADDTWHIREVGMLGWKKCVKSPNTRQFSSRLLSRLLQKLPFLVEVWVSKPNGRSPHPAHSRLAGFVSSVRAPIDSPVISVFSSLTTPANASTLHF